jgi:hypothetical protein
MPDPRRNPDELEDDDEDDFDVFPEDDDLDLDDDGGSAYDDSDVDDGEQDECEVCGGPHATSACPEDD